MARIALAALGIAALVICSACGGGTGSGGGSGGLGPLPAEPASAIHAKSHRGENCLDCHTTWNLAALHEESALSSQADCIGCHGFMLDETSLALSIPGPHVGMIQSFLGSATTAPNNQTCTGCHSRTDWFDESGAQLRRQVQTSPCWACHREGGQALPVLYNN